LNDKEDLQLVDVLDFTAEQAIPEVTVDELMN
jgi:hypothetical protein